MRTPLPALVCSKLAPQPGVAAELLERFGLPSNTPTERAVMAPIDRLDRFYNEAARLLGAPNLGLELSGCLGRGAYGLVEFSIRSSPTVREALARIGRYATLINEATAFEFVEGAEESECSVLVPGSNVGLGRHPNEFFVAFVVTQLREMSTGAFVPTRVWFAHAAPDDLTTHHELFGTNRINFGAQHCGFAISNDALGAAMSTADSALLDAIEVHAKQALTERDADSGPDFLASVRQAIRDSLTSGDPALATVARQIAMTSRTLQRRLSERETSFRRQVDRVRAELAQVYRDKGMPANEIAYLLGYAEMGPFRRASQRWTRQQQV